MCPINFFGKNLYLYYVKKYDCYSAGCGEFGGLTTTFGCIIVKLFHLFEATIGCFSQVDNNVGFIDGMV